MTRFSSAFSCAVAVRRQDAAGEERDDSSAISSEPTMVVTTVMGSTRMNLPALPGSASSGRKAKISVAVQPRIADEDLPRAGQRRGHARIAHAQVARDVLDHHDGIVDQQAERDHEAGDRHLVERIAEEIQQREAEGSDSGIDTITMPRRAGPAAAASAHQRDGDAEVRVQAVEPVATLRDWSKRDLEADALAVVRRRSFRPPRATRSRTSMML